MFWSISATPLPASCHFIPHAPYYGLKKLSSVSSLLLAATPFQGTSLALHIGYRLHCPLLLKPVQMLPLPLWWRGWQITLMRLKPNTEVSRSIVTILKLPKSQLAGRNTVISPKYSPVAVLFSAQLWQQSVKELTLPHPLIVLLSWELWLYWRPVLNETLLDQSFVYNWTNNIPAAAI